MGAFALQGSRQLLANKHSAQLWDRGSVVPYRVQTGVCPAATAMSRERQCSFYCKSAKRHGTFTCNYLSTHQLTKDSLLHRHTIIFKPEKIIIISQFHLILCPYSDFPNFLKIAVFSLNQNPKFMNCISVSPPENFSLLIFEIISNLEKNGKNNAKNPWLSLT